MFYFRYVLSFSLPCCFNVNDIDPYDIRAATGRLWSLYVEYLNLNWLLMYKMQLYSKAKMCLEPNFTQSRSYETFNVAGTVSPSYLQDGSGERQLSLLREH